MARKDDTEHLWQFRERSPLRAAPADEASGERHATA
jgi:hypothetical protein